MSQPETLAPSATPADSTNDLNLDDFFINFPTPTPADNGIPTFVAPVPTRSPFFNFPTFSPHTLPTLLGPPPTRRPTSPPTPEPGDSFEYFFILIFLSIFLMCYLVFNYMQKDPTEDYQDPTAGVVHRIQADHANEGVQAIELQELPEAEPEPQPARFEPTTVAQAVEAVELQELTEEPTQNGGPYARAKAKKEAPTAAASLDLTYPSPAYPASYAETYSADKTK